MCAAHEVTTLFENMEQSLQEIETISEQIVKRREAEARLEEREAWAASSLERTCNSAVLGGCVRIRTLLRERPGSNGSSEGIQGIIDDLSALRGVVSGVQPSLKAYLQELRLILDAKQQMETLQTDLSAAWERWAEHQQEVATTLGSLDAVCASSQAGGP